MQNDSLPEGEALAGVTTKNNLGVPVSPQRAAPRWGAFLFSNRFRGCRAPNPLPPSASISRCGYHQAPPLRGGTRASTLRFICDALLQRKRPEWQPAIPGACISFDVFVYEACDDTGPSNCRLVSSACATATMG